jgi:hypothetical protein
LILIINIKIPEKEKVVKKRIRLPPSLLRFVLEGKAGGGHGGFAVFDPFVFFRKGAAA